MKQTLLIEPSDVWLFRDARPFAAGEQGRAVSVFPPTPQTVQGAIRSARLSLSGEPFDVSMWSDALRKEIGDPDSPGKVALRGPLVAQRSDGAIRLHFPMPADTGMFAEGFRMLSPRHLDKPYMNGPQGIYPLLPPEGSQPVKFSPFWLDGEGLAAYLNGDVAHTRTYPSDTLFSREARVGVGIDSAVKRPIDGLLYQVEFVRPLPDVGLVVEVDGISLPPSGFLQLGGEAKAARYEAVDAGIDSTSGVKPAERVTDLGNVRQFKIYLATPALFETGWLPACIDATTHKGTWNGVDVTLRAAAIGKPQVIGGRDVARGIERPIRRAVPAGSVYFFETPADGKDIATAFDGRNVSDLSVDAQIGFGLAFIGGW